MSEELRGTYDDEPAESTPSFFGFFLWFFGLLLLAVVVFYILKRRRAQAAAAVGVAPANMPAAVNTPDEELKGVIHSLMNR